MLSDSSKILDTQEQLEQLMADNDIERPATRYNSFNQNINAFPYAEVLLRLNERIQNMERFLREKGLEIA